MIFTDQLGRNIHLKNAPKRIVSLVPSQTEFLYDLGVGNHVVGQTQFCIHPKWAFKNATKIGGTKKLNLEKIRALNPDLIIANKEENDQNQIEILANEFPVWISDIYNLNDALQMMLKLGEILQKLAIAIKIVKNIETEFEALLNTKNNPINPIKILYFIWKEPYMVAGRNTFIQSIIESAGFVNVITQTNSRYPEISIHEIEQLNPQAILLSSEPFPFTEKHIKEFLEMCPSATVRIVDGEMFTWYGSRLIQAPKYLLALKNEL